MNVRAKFRCMSIQHIHTGNPDASVANIALSPVWEQEGVNRTWSQATPQGKLEMTITNAEAIDAFELGREYFLDISPAVAET